ncbi:syncoilin-like [Sphaeramia orbicularis]|uniref:syncoilin-like n=1 Tax=Sphaeramia orbicularis TaxID=375764 RepID=UPI00117E7675|nr:syncoilin [Sphaeramia orbicularis]
MDNLRAKEGSKDGENRVYTEDLYMEFKYAKDVKNSSSPDSEETLIPQEERTQYPTNQKDRADMDNLGQIFEHCIQQVSRLEIHRDQLIQELLQLQEPMVQIVKHLRGKLVEAQRLLTLAHMDYIAVYEDVQQVKKNLFATARDCIQSQVTLATHEYEVAQSAVTQEELKAYIKSLSQEMSQLHEAHQNRLNAQRDQSSRFYRPRAMSDVGLCRQASGRMQRRLSESVKTLESLYEPRLMALLRRRQIGEDALRKSREQAKDLRARLGPLKEDIQRLEVQRACLEQRIHLMEAEREDSLTQHKENVEKLKETLRDLGIEFEVQKRSKKNLEDVKDSLLTELAFHRSQESRETAAEEDLI